MLRHVALLREPRGVPFQKKVIFPFIYFYIFFAFQGYLQWDLARISAWSAESIGITLDYRGIIMMTKQLQKIGYWKGGGVIWSEKRGKSERVMKFMEVEKRFAGNRSSFLDFARKKLVLADVTKHRIKEAGMNRRSCKSFLTQLLHKRSYGQRNIQQNETEREDHKKAPWPLVRNGIIPTDRPPLVG
jgi:hypothetical protein